ncbi:hypothetical protein HK097_000847 [Rhizophlyctis rosea]|uniref:AB hydrolase-1 domain-containing protein n=1 Tax=Rhizophlyctis rosea TaxID=64517 RepID=A0AAD5S519_9FUNG|nr:hypothetical protein HK097_000847 [Rhizophlyctis rosea]
MRPPDQDLNPNIQYFLKHRSNVRLVRPPRSTDPHKFIPLFVVHMDSHPEPGAKTFGVVFETYEIKLSDNNGSIPLDRRCSLGVYHATGGSRRDQYELGEILETDGKAKSERVKGAVLLVPGFASNKEIFDLGGGRGRSGSSFVETIARAGYDTYCIDLRGTAQAKTMGSTSAASLREYVEHDIPDAIQAIKAIGGHRKVYLIGHSMGGALSCAAAGLWANDIAGVVHLAGLYEWGMPIAHAIEKAYEHYAPEPVKSLLRTVRKYGKDPLRAVLSPIADYCSDAIGPPIPAEHLSLDQLKQGLPYDLSDVLRIKDPYSEMERFIGVRRSYVKAHLSRAIRATMRLPLPFRELIGMVLLAKRIVPRPIEKWILDRSSASLWVKDALEDPYGLIAASLENPSWGVSLSMIRLGLENLCKFLERFATVPFYFKELINHWIFVTQTTAGC